VPCAPGGHGAAVLLRCQPCCGGLGARQRPGQPQQCSQSALWPLAAAPCARQRAPRGRRPVSSSACQGPACGRACPTASGAGRPAASSAASAAPALHGPTRMFVRPVSRLSQRASCCALRPCSWASLRPRAHPQKVADGWEGPHVPGAALAHLLASEEHLCARFLGMLSSVTAMMIGAWHTGRVCEARTRADLQHAVAGEARALQLLRRVVEERHQQHCLAGQVRQGRRIPAGLLRTVGSAHASQPALGTPLAGTLVRSARAAAQPLASCAHPAEHTTFRPAHGTLLAEGRTWAARWRLVHCKPQCRAGRDTTLCAQATIWSMRDLAA